ncbi:MAG: exodeoxyribonuclease VII large subunit [Puniceicoccaceae bacterium]
MESNPAGITVSELTTAIQQQLRVGFPDVVVRGEISNLRKQSSGHIYFSLKDNTSQISAVFFRANAVRSPVDLENGMEVLARGAIDVYAPRGNYQLIVREVKRSGIGGLQEEFLRLKAKLEAEGLFSQERKRPLPDLPGRIALVTSASGAALQDMLSVFRRRGWRGTLILLPAIVQGKEAVPSILGRLDQIEELKLEVDLVILARGGGSIEDLAAFNGEKLVRRLASLPHPLISAIGHETDLVLTDFVADRRAETPTAAAELVTSAYVVRRDGLEDLSRRLKRRTNDFLRELKGNLERASLRIGARTPLQVLEFRNQAVDELERRLDNLASLRLERLRERFEQRVDLLWRLEPTRRIEERRRNLGLLRERADRAVAVEIRSSKERVVQLGERLKATSLPSILKRGFALVRNDKGAVINRAGALSKGERLRIDLASGAFFSKVDELLEVETTLEERPWQSDPGE